MLATFINAALVLAGSLLGLLLRGHFSEQMGETVVKGLGLCVLGIGLTSLLQTENTLCLIVCMALGTLLGERLNIEGKIDMAGEYLKKKLIKNSSRFVEGFVTATVIYCVGAMAINGSLAAGLKGDYSILISKGVIDGLTAITFTAAMGIGVAFSIVPLILYQGGLTLLAGAVGPYLSGSAIIEMSAVGGAVIVGIALNMLQAGREKLRVGNMLPAIFLPLVYLPLAGLFVRG